MPVLRILLLPFAFLYKLVTDFRNHLYDIGNKKSVEFDRFIISVGNLTVGGTGKTPFVELLIRALKKEYRLAVLSRGYKRKSRGFKLAEKNDDSISLGDEPFQYLTKYGKEIRVVVGEDRMQAIPELIFRDDSIEVVILDDAYQHRSVRTQLNILLCDYNRPFYHDYVMPAGLLRESRRHAQRADICIVTKCPEELRDGEMDEISSQIEKYANDSTPIYFTGIKYLKPERLFGTGGFSENIYLFSGIANSLPLEKYVDQNYNLLRHKKYSDHYSFTQKDIKEIIKSFESFNSDSKCLLTTEKDMVRLLSLKEEAGFLMDYPVFYLPIELYFLRNGDFFAQNLNETVKQGLKRIEIN